MLYSMRWDPVTDLRLVKGSRRLARQAKGGSIDLSFSFDFALCNGDVWALLLCPPPGDCQHYLQADRKRCKQCTVKHCQEWLTPLIHTHDHKSHSHWARLTPWKHQLWTQDRPAKNQELHTAKHLCVAEMLEFRTRALPYPTLKEVRGLRAWRGTGHCRNGPVAGFRKGSILRKSQPNQGNLY